MRKALLFFDIYLHALRFSYIALFAFFQLFWYKMIVKPRLSLPFSLCSLTDKVPVFGTGDGGSIPSRGTKCQRGSKRLQK